MYNYVDTWQPIFKDDGRPLTGKLEFCDPVTTELKTIYDVDGNELENPIYCNVVPSHQVMLDNGDYTVRYYEYIGFGNMESDNNQDSWRLYKTELVKQNVLEAENDATTLYASVTTINALKDLSVPSDGSTVEVIGYSDAEDCPARYFVWHANGNWTDDGGIVIKSNNTTTGAWVMKIPYDYIDVRWYGDIPSDSPTVNSGSLGQRAKAATAANLYRKNLYFPAYGKGNANGYYIFDGSNTVSVNDNIICDSGVRWVVKAGTNGTSVSCKELVKPNEGLFVSEGLGIQIGGYSLTADWIRTSWYYADKTAMTGAREGYIVDHMNAPLSASGTKLKIIDPNMTLTISGCEIVECYKKFTQPVVMSNMEIETDWFADDYSWGNLTITGCKILLDNCSSANLYVNLKNKQLEADYGDLQEMSLSGVTLLNGALVENATFTNVTLGNSAELHNISGTFVGTSTTVLNMIDCWITLTADMTISSVQWRRGSLSGAYTLSVLNNSYLDDVQFAGNFDAIGTATAKLVNCQVQSGATVSAGVLDVYNCEISGTVAAKAPASVLTANICSNRFLGTGKFAMKTTNMSGTEFTTAIKVTGNFSDHDFVDDSDFADVTHTTGPSSFVYRENFGGCPVNEAHSLQVIGYSLVRLQDGEDPRVIPAQTDNTIKLIEDWRHNAGDSSNDVKRQIWWCLKLNYSFTPGSSNLFVFKNINMSRSFRFMPSCRCSFKNGQYGESINEFPMPQWIATVSPSSPTVTKSGTYTMQQQVDTMYTNSSIDEKRSRLTVLLGSAINPSGWDPDPTATITWNIYS